MGPISQKEEDEFKSPEGIIQIPADKLQKPTEEKGDIKTFVEDYYTKGKLDETGKIEPHTQDIQIGLPSYEDRVSEDIVAFPELGKVNISQRDELENSEVKESIEQKEEVT